MIRQRGKTGKTKIYSDEELKLRRRVASRNWYRRKVGLPEDSLTVVETSKNFERDLEQILRERYKK